MATIKGGKKFKQAIEDLKKKLQTAKTLKVGFIEGATYPDGTSVPMVAAINEFGAPSRGQPPRPFFRRMIKAKQGEWAPVLKRLLKENDYNAEIALQILGKGIEDQLKASINELVDPPLAPSTIKRKGFDKPLIDTSLMINSTTFNVD